MTPKEKVLEIYEKALKILPMPDGCSWCSCNEKCRKKNDAAIDFVIIAVDEILKSRPCLPICISTDGGSSEAIIDANNFW